MKQLERVEEEIAEEEAFDDLGHVHGGVEVRWEGSGRVIKNGNGIYVVHLA